MKLSSDEKKKIASAIATAETITAGEIRVHISYSAKEENIFDSAKGFFEKLKMHQTDERNGILLYFNLQLRKFALFGDQGIHEKVGQPFWDTLSEQVKSAIQAKTVTDGILVAVQSAAKALSEHFPHRDGQVNELSDEVTESH